MRVCLFGGLVCLTFVALITLGPRPGKKGAGLRHLIDTSYANLLPDANGRANERMHVSRVNVEEIEPWHLYEDASVEARAKPLRIPLDGVHHERMKRASDGSLFYHPLEHIVHEQRQRRDPDPDGTYWYHPLFHDRTDSTPSDELGPERPKPSTAAITASSNAITVAVYYYPWYNKDFHGRKYVRGELNPPQMPVLGEYNDRNPAVISQHLKWSQQANIKLWVASWWGPNSGTDVTIQNHIMPHPELGNMKLCLFYETMGRIDVVTRDTSNVYGDISYAAETYFNHPNYYKIGDRPVVFVYLTRSLERLDLLRGVISAMRTAASTKGHLLYIVGDHAYGNPPKAHLDALDWLDAVTNYDIFGGMGQPNGYAKKKAVLDYSREQAEWKRAANKQGCAYIPGATPGYNDKAVRDGDYTAMSRKLTKRREYGSLFKALLRTGKKLIDTKASNMLIVNSFNEWHEDTQIEPVVQGGRTKRPWSLTKGKPYEGYGELFLDILSMQTSSKPKRSRFLAS